LYSLTYCAEAEGQKWQLLSLLPSYLLAVFLIAQSKLVRKTAQMRQYAGVQADSRIDPEVRMGSR
jgi:hypothetical protein